MSARCNMPPGPEAVECEAWVVAQNIVSAAPMMLLALLLAGPAWGPQPPPGPAFEWAGRWG